MVDVLNRKSAVERRSELLDLVTRDLLGPGGGLEEELDGKSAPRRWYLVGFLAPSHQLIQRQESDDMGDRDPDESEDGQPEPTALQATTLRPSSIGISFSVGLDVDEVAVRARWGSYEKMESSVLTADNGNPLRVWQRTQHDYLTPVSLEVGVARTQPVSEFAQEVLFRVQCRQIGDSKVVSLFLVNSQTEPAQNRDEAWLFQVELEVSGTDGSAVFKERKFLQEQGNLSDDYWDELRTQAMRYRQCGEYAVGHGIAVTVERDGPLAHKLKTCVIPVYEVAAQDQPTFKEAPHLRDLPLDMEEISNIPDGQFTKTLEPLIKAYDVWVLEQEQSVKSGFLQEYQEQADAALLRCLVAQDRLREGLKVLDTHPQAAAAFRFANLAMARQRVRSIFAQNSRRGVKQDIEDLQQPKNRSWRLFQLAFFLLNVPGIFDPLHPSRSDPDQHLVDLLWFPTGGGKTEAYLGVAAFAMGLRRLQGQVGEYDGQFGVAVLMRYTLRLLTLQQFQRAAALICACEDIRREAKEQGRNPWGEEPFRIGLWVGQKTTPNRTDDADEAIKDSRGGGFSSRSGNPLQLTSCPWCGTKIDAGKHVEVETFKRGRARTLVYCGDSMGDCLFSKRRSKGEGLPVITVDEEIYRRLPSLLISTVDKFAQMPWRGETAMLFGRVNAFCPRHGFRSPDMPDTDSHPAKDGMPSVKSKKIGLLRPPDLIIQDELHLISGPLGTLVGLYESVVDELCSWQLNGKKVRPKIIASTATVRQAAEQIQGVFARKVEIFPSPGIEAGDNFFARQRTPSVDFPGRIYIGICAPGSSIKGALIRVYSAFLSAAQVQYERYGKDADPWMTLAGYFSSLRELGSMRRSCDDSVRSWVRRYEDRGLANRNVSGVTELTSRVASSEIPRILDDLEVRFEPQAEQERKAAWKAGKQTDLRKPVDILLATNMISVGVDVNRLGLMVVTGQPKNTAEYIQATSRVGRDKNAPGIVCTVYNWARPRDLSHYEKFEHFHATFYQHVEALSVTPFAPRALDRGLTSVFCAAARLFAERYNANESAESFSSDDPGLQELLQAMTERVRVVAGQRAAEEFQEQIDARCQRWDAKIKSLVSGTRLGYKRRKDGLTVPLLSEPDGLHWNDWTVLNSLRNVEPMVGLILTGDGMGVTDE